jgi:hypothetical protein
MSLKNWQKGAKSLKNLSLSNMFQDSSILNKQKENTVRFTLHNVGTNTFVLVRGMYFSENT